MIYGLPTCLEVNGTEYPIRYEYTAVLDIIESLNDPDLEDKEKALCVMYILYETFEDIPKEDYQEAFEKALAFIDNGVKDTKKKNNVRLVDFEQDASLMFPAINRVAGREIRNDEDIHWWTFLGWFMEIGECAYSQVLNIRSKRSKGKKLEKWEEEYYRENKKIVDIQVKLSQEEQDELEELKKLLDG